MIGKNRILVRFILIGLFTVGLHAKRIDAQSDTSRLSISVRANVYHHAKKPVLQNLELRFLPAASWEVNISYDVIRKSQYKFSVFYERGSLPVRIDVNVPAYSHPDIEYELDFLFYYSQHPYNTLGVGYSLGIDQQWITVGLANRFYSTSRAENGITVHTTTGPVIDVLDCATRFNRNYFCPQATIGISGRIWKKIPSWNYEINFAFIPVEVIKGAFTFFPDDPNYVSSGNFQIPQSNISVGLLYRRVKRTP